MALTANEQKLFDLALSILPHWFKDDQRSMEHLALAAKAVGAAWVQLLDWFGNTLIGDAVGATGYDPDWLNQHAIDRGTSRQAGEGDTELALRIRSVPDLITRVALLTAAQAIVDSLSISGTVEMVELRKDKGFFGTFGPEDVVWTSDVNVSVSGNTITKNAGGAAWNAGAVSTKSIKQGRNGYIEWKAEDYGSYSKLAGLSYGDTNQSDTDVDFSWYQQWDGALGAYESNLGSLLYTGTWANGDMLRIGVVDGVVHFWQNNDLRAVGTVAPTFPLLMDTSIYSVGATIAEARICFGSTEFSTVGVGGVFTKPSTNVQRFEPYQLPWARPPFDERPPDYAWQLTTKGADDANNDVTGKEIKAMYGDAAEFINTPGVADSEDLGVYWKTQKLDQDLNLADGYARAFFGRGYRMARSGPASSFIIIIPYTSDTDARQAAESSITEMLRQKHGAGVIYYVESRTSA